MTRPLLLDLYCGAGGAAMGYHRAGFEVIGVDHQPQPHYPFEFHQGDALAPGLIDLLDDFDAVHASPPCQRWAGFHKANPGHHDLITPTRLRLERSGLPYLIENVPGSPLRASTMLCGSMFELSSPTWGTVIRRHRLFETGGGFELPLLALPECRHQPRNTVSVVGNGTPSWSKGVLGRNTPVAEWCELMGIDWMTRDELAEAIPPAYTEWLGGHLLAHLSTGVA